MGGITGAGVKGAARWGLALGGFGGLPVLAAAGGLAGAGRATIKEYLTQRREIVKSEEARRSKLMDEMLVSSFYQSNWDEKKQNDPSYKEYRELADGSIKGILKNEFRRIKSADKTKLRNAALRGAVIGAIGGVVGGMLVEKIAEHGEDIGAVLSGVKDHIGQGVQELKTHIPHPQFEHSAVNPLPAPPPEPSAAGVSPEQAISTPIASEGVKVAMPSASISDNHVASMPQIQETPSSSLHLPSPVDEFPKTPADQLVSPSGTSGIHPIPAPEAVNHVLGPTALNDVAVPIEQAATSVHETMTLESGSTVWDKVHEQLATGLGHESSVDQMRQGVTGVLNANHITDASHIQAGTQIDMHSVTEQIQQITGGHELIPSDLSSMPESVSLDHGSTVWSEATDYLKAAGIAQPNNAQILDVAKEVCRQSNISEPSWGISGEHVANQLPTGFNLVFNQPVKSVVSGMMK